MIQRLSLIAALTLTASLPATAAAEDPERVIMKLDDFLEMYEKGKTKKEDEEPPRDHAIASAHYKGEVLFEDGKPYAARFKAKFEIRALRSKGFARIPLLPATVAVERATIGGRAAAVVIENGFYTLITDRRGDFSLDVVFGASVTSAEGSNSVTFQLTPSGATSLNLAVPSSESLDFTVANAKLKSDSVVGADRVVNATIPATGSLSISWQRKVEEAEAKKKEARVYSEVYTLTSVGDGILRAKTTVQNTILFAGIEQLRYQIPKGMTVLDVTGPGIRAWKADGDALNVQLNFAAEGSYGLTIDLEQPLPSDANVSAPIVVPQGTERSKGWLGVEARGNVELKAGNVSDATAVDVRALPGSILGVTDQPVLLGYKYLGKTPTIALTAEQHDEVEVLVTLLDQTVADTMWTREGRRLTSVTYQVRNNRRQFLKLSLPEGAKLWSASVGGRGVQPAKASDGRVMVPLLRSQQAGNNLSAFAVTVVYVESGPPASDKGKGTFTAQLPTPDVPSTYVAWTVHSPDGTKIKRRSIDGSLQRVDAHSRPVGAIERGYMEVPEEPAYVEQKAANMPGAPADGGGALGGNSAMAAGAAPVMVSLPIAGDEMYFEKLLALGEPLQVRFNYRGLRRSR